MHSNRYKQVGLVTEIDFHGKNNDRMISFNFSPLQKSELEMEDKPERVSGAQQHQRLVASFNKQIAIQEKKLEEVWLESAQLCFPIINAWLILAVAQSNSCQFPIS